MDHQETSVLPSYVLRGKFPGQELLLSRVALGIEVRDAKGEFFALVEPKALLESVSALAECEVAR